MAQSSVSVASGKPVNFQNFYSRKKVQSIEKFAKIDITQCGEQTLSQARVYELCEKFRKRR